jgi:transposase
MQELIGLEDVIVTKVERKDNQLDINLIMPRRIHSCPRCNSNTDKIHDYRIQKIKDISSFGSHTILHLRKRRYVCPFCNKRFYEQIPFLPRYHRITSRLIANILNSLRTVHSIKDVAKTAKVSSTTATRIFDHIKYSNKSLPRVVSMDEFKGNAGGEKFHEQRRKYFKRSRRVLLKRPENLTPSEVDQVEAMLSISERLRHAYVLKNEFYKVMDSSNSYEAKKQLAKWYMLVYGYKLPEFDNCFRAFNNWQKEILNSFDVPYTNGYTEGVNNKIKVIKRNAFGMKNFERFRNRILHVMA